MTQQEIKEFKEKATRTTQRLIRVVIEEMTDPSKGRLTTRGVIQSLQEAIDYLETSALLTSPENYLEKANRGLECIPTCQLLAELEKRDGVETNKISPSASIEVKADGPAIVFTVID